MPDPLHHHAPPMPLKHFTETFLVVVLGAVIAVTGLLTATLPSLPDGALPWALLFVLSIVYPLSLYSLFQRRRADNFFRNLHWFPAAILLVWLLMQGISLRSGTSTDGSTFFTWSWSLVPVALGFVLIILFCLKVIRRRVPRLSFLALILIPFTAVAIVSEQGNHWESELASVMWSADFWQVDESGLLASWIRDRAVDDSPQQQEDESENKWRERLAAQKRREERIAARMDGGKDTQSEVVEEPISHNGEEIRNADTMPSTLPDSGFGWSTIILTLLALYSGAVHNRTRKRV